MTPRSLICKLQSTTVSPIVLLKSYYKSCLYFDVNTIRSVLSSFNFNIFWFIHSLISDTHNAINLRTQNKTLWDSKVKLLIYGYGVFNNYTLYPTGEIRPEPIKCIGVRCSPLLSTSQLLRPSDQQCSHSGGSVYKYRGDNGVRMWVQLKRWCVSCVWMLHMGHSGDGCVLASTLCKCDLRKGD